VPSGWQEATALADSRDPIDLDGVDDAHLRIVGLLARARLEARRRGDDLTFTRASEELRELVTFCGLDDVLDLGPPEPSDPEAR